MESLLDKARANGLASERYEVIEGDLARHREAVIDIWRGHVGWRNQLERMYDVCYLGCPHGKPVLRLLQERSSGKMVGTIGAGPRRMLWQGREIRGAVVSQMVVSPGHRTLAPALMLSRALITACDDRFDLVYALPNAMSGAVCRRAGFRPIGQLRRYVKLLRYKPYLPRVLPDVVAQVGGSLLDAVVAMRRRGNPKRHDELHATWTDAVTPGMQALWENSDHGEALSTIRTTSMLQWRLLGLPALERRFLLVAKGTSLAAWFACETNVRDNGIMTVTDAWSADGVHGFDRSTIRMLCAMAYQAGFHAVEANLAAAPAVIAMWRAEGFVPRGQHPVFAKWTSTRKQGDIGAALHLTDIEQDG